MEQAIVEVLRQSPIAIVLFWMVSVFKKKDEEQTAHVRELHTKMMNVIENNTSAITSVKSTIQENTKATETLSNRIYDVLTNKHGNPDSV